ncbi:MAG: FAD-dependent monooxygenase [Gammaproteobacteria bacterium]
MPPEFDCIVVGAGLVGSAAACTLAASGRRVLVVERRAPLHTLPDDVRALVLAPASVQVLGRCGLWPALAPHAAAIRRIHISERGAFGRVRLDAAEAGLAALGWSCPADVMLREMNGGLVHGDGIEVRWSTRFIDARARDDAIEVELATPAGEARVSARLLVGADGARSAVRHAAGIELDSVDYGQSAIVANLEAPALAADLALEHFTDEGPLALIPRGGARFVSVQCLAREHAQAAASLAAPEYLAQLAARAGQRLGPLTALGPRRLHPLARQRARSLTGARTVILGNAANTVHPNGAQGLNLGLRDVAALDAALRAADDAGASEALAAYAALRARDHRAIGGFTHAAAQAFASTLLPARCARRVVLGALAHVPALRRALVAELSGLGALARLGVAPESPA